MMREIKNMICLNKKLIELSNFTNLTKLETFYKQTLVSLQVSTKGTLFLAPFAWHFSI